MDNPIAFGQSVSLDVFGFQNIIAINDLKKLIDPRKHPIVDGNMLFIGVLPLFIILITPAILFLSRRQVTQGLVKTSLLLLTVAACAFIIMIGHVTPIVRILHSLPFITQVRELRYAIIWHLCMALLTGVGIQIISLLKLIEKMPLKIMVVFLAIGLSVLFGSI